MHDRPTRRALLGATAVAALAALPVVPAIAASAAPASRGDQSRVRTPDGLELAVESWGAPGAPEILLIHGLGQSRLSWSRQTSSALTERFRLVAFDLRGHGDSDKPADIAAYTQGARWGDDVQAVVAGLKLRRPVLVGWSLGGLAVGHYLARHGREHVAGVNLVDAVTRLTPDLLTPAARRFAGALASRDFAVRTQAIEQFLLACFVSPPPEADLRRMLVTNGMVPREVQEGIVKIGSEGLDQAFAGVERMLVTFGARDALTKETMSRRVLDLNPRAHMSTYADVGHAPFYEDAARFNRELSDFATLV